MRIHHRISLSLFIFIIVLFILITAIYTIINKKHEIEAAKLLSALHISEAARNIETHIHEQISIARTLANSWVLKNELKKSNEILGKLGGNERAELIKSLNDRWMATRDINDPYVQSYMTSTAAGVLKEHVEIFPGIIGEAFITDSFGKVIGTTNKLTTVAHSHKYWWIESFNNAKGKVFIDDRGFDDSVGGYVLGIVVPVFDAEKTIGILKVNVNIVESMRHIVSLYEEAGPEQVMIVRSLGKIVYETGSEPLSTSIDKRIVEQFSRNPRGNITLDVEGHKLLHSYDMLPLSRGSDRIGFGGTKRSIDHRGGNVGEGWYVVIIRNYDDILERVTSTNTLIAVCGVILSLLMGFLALYIGKSISRPIEIISGAAREIGEGNFNKRVDISKGDEIGNLASALNSMASNLSNITASRDELDKEVSERKTAEGLLRQALDDKDMLMREVHHRAKNNLVVIQSLLSLQLKDITDDKSKGYFADAQNRVKSMGMIHEMLHNSDDIAKLGTSEYIRKFVDTLLHNYKANTHAIRLEYDIQDIRMDVDTMIPLGLIINELVSNALKYAYPDDGEGALSISLKEAGQAGFELIVKDNGVGLPEDFDSRKASSLGLRIVNSLVKQISGVLEVSNMDGAEFRVVFKEKPVG
jgi:two-component sensor histidine kinase/HAMP domain-containing protein